MRLNLGCCDTVIPGFIGVDIVPPADQIVDLSGPWQWPDSSVEEVRAHDVIEHISDIPRMIAVTGKPVWRHPIGRIHFMNELHRVLVPCGKATIETPNAARGVGYFQDPTHVSPWCLSTFKYFEAGAFAHTRLAKAYGITAAFRIVTMESRSNGEDAREEVWKITAILEAVK